MRPEVATLEAVEGAVREIKASGLEPTAARILAITKGSKDTVLRHMRALGVGAFRKEPEDDTETLPLVLVEKARPFIKELFATANELASARYIGFTERYHRAMDELETGLVELGTQLQAAQTDNAALRAENTALRDENEFLTLERDEQRENNAGLDRRALDAEMRVRELEALNKSLESAATNMADIEARMKALVVQTVGDQLRQQAG
jgi:hypothetical protein